MTWIPVTEKLPAPAMPVLVTGRFPTGHERMRIARHFEHRNYWVSATGGFPIDGEVTHWRPLPELPRED